MNLFRDKQVSLECASKPMEKISFQTVFQSESAEITAYLYNYSSSAIVFSTSVNTYRNVGIHWHLL